MFATLSFASLFVYAMLAAAFPGGNSTVKAPRKVGKRCTGTISSLSDVSAAQKCTTIVINSFTVPAGETFLLDAPDGATVTLNGDLTFAFKTWDGPLMEVKGDDVTFNGGGHTLNGLGAQYWDGQGGNGGVTKPAPLLRINNGGSFSNVVVLNSPGRGVAIGGNSVTVSGVTVNNAAGAAPNSLSGGKPAGANTDGFDVSANDVTIENCVVTNQDDCLAINKGTNIVFKNNQCSGGHGISVGSIKSDTTVSGVTISGNTVTNSVNGLRIKTIASSTDSTVSGVTYTGNTLSGITQFGVIIDQSYPDTLGTPGTGVVIENIQFTGTNTVAVGSSAHRVEINCGSTSSCPGTWDFSGLKVTGGEAGSIVHASVSGGSF